MTPEATTATAIITIIQELGGWSVGGVTMAVCITPALFVYLTISMVVKSITGLRADLVIFKVQYDNNITFVKTYQDLVVRLEDTLRLNTIAMTKLCERIGTIKDVKQ